MRQSVSVTLIGSVPKAASSAVDKTVRITLVRTRSSGVPAVGLGMPAQEIDAAIEALDLLERAAPRLLICQFDPRQKHGRKELEGYRLLCERTGAQCELEVVVESIDAFRAELTHVASLVRGAALALSAVAVCPVGDLKGILPGSPRPPAPPLADLYDAARAAFPGFTWVAARFPSHRAQPKATAGGAPRFRAQRDLPHHARSRRPLGDGDP